MTVRSDIRKESDYPILMRPPPSDSAAESSSTAFFPAVVLGIDHGPSIALFEGCDIVFSYVEAAVNLVGKILMSLLKIFLFIRRRGFRFHGLRVEAKL